MMQNNVRSELKKGYIGRDHHPYAFTMWLAGGGIKGPLRALTSNIKIDEYKQALFLKSRALQASGGQLSHGRLELLRELTAYCSGQSFTRPLVVVAAAGGGKTALLSLFLAYYLDSTAPFAGKACPSHRISPLSSKQKTSSPDTRCSLGIPFLLGG